MLLVTTGHGQIGSTAAAAARRLGLSVRLGVRRPSAAATDEVALDFEVPAGWPAALSGCSTVLLVRPPAVADTRRTLCPFVDTARAAGVRHIAFVSVAGAERRRWVPHWRVEAHLRAGPADWTVLRPGFFVQNIATAYRQDILQDGRVYVPAGAGRVAFIDVADVGAVAAAVLARADAPRGRVLTLTGPAAVGFDALAAALGHALARPVRYQPASVPGYAWHLRHARRLPWAQVAVQTVLHVGLRHGDAAAVTQDVASVLGRRATPLAEAVQRTVHGWPVA